MHNKTPQYDKQNHSCDEISYSAQSVNNRISINLESRVSARATRVAEKKHHEQKSNEEKKKREKKKLKVARGALVLNLEHNQNSTADARAWNHLISHRASFRTPANRYIRWGLLYSHSLRKQAQDCIADWWFYADYIFFILVSLFFF